MAAAAACAQAGAQTAVAQEPGSGGRDTLSIERFVSLGGTYTDNGSLSSSSGGSDFMTRASAGVRVLAQTARVQGWVDYELTGILHSRESDANEIQNALNAFGRAELLDRRAFIDVGAGISQQLVSVFGTRSADPALDNRNRQEVTDFLVSPYLQGPLGRWMDYQARFTYSGTRSDEEGASENTVKRALLRLEGDEALHPLFWSVDASRNVIDYSAGRENEDDRLEGLLGWSVTRELQVAVIAGRESNNYLSLQKQAHDTYGAQVSWTPSERTNATARVQRRFFGTGHTLSASHHTNRWSVLYSDSRDVVTSPSRTGVGNFGRAFDLFDQQFTSLQPDPVLRRQMVLLFLSLYGIDPQSIVLAQFQASSATLERQQQLSFAWRWVRDTVVFSAARSQSRRLDTIVSVIDDFTQSSTIRQDGLSMNYSHRLTPSANAGLDLSWQKVSGDLQQSTLRSAALTWSTRVGRQSDVAASLRHSRFSGTGDSYNETALSATYSLRF